MNRYTAATLFLVYFALCSACRSHPGIKGLVDTLTAGGYGIVSDTLPVIDTTNTIEKRFKRIGKSAIPYLIDAIDRNERGWVGFKEERSSSLVLNFGNFSGITAAYMIEYLLSDSSGYQIYPNGVICRVNHQTGHLYQEKLTLDDVKAVKKIYRSWWEANKNKSMEELKSDWRRGKRALYGTDYAWI
jgi:hypothetical protein